MKILLIQENGRHNKNRHFRECFCLQRGLTLLGHKADVWGLNHDSWPTQPNFESYDLILNLENYQEVAGNWVPDLSNVNAIKFLWSIDAHCKGVGSYDKDFERGNYNLLLHSTKDYVVSKDRVWFPNAYDDTLIYPMNVDKKCDVGFVGNTVNREEYINFLQQKFNFKFDNFVIGEDMVKTLNSYKVSWNKNMANDINYRSFETIGCGVPLVTNYNPQYEELGFTHGENVAMYTDLENMVQCIESLIQNNELREKIAINGLELAKKHTYLERCRLLVQIYKEYISGQSITGFKL